MSLATTAPVTTTLGCRYHTTPLRCAPSARFQHPHHSDPNPPPSQPFRPPPVITYSLHPVSRPLHLLPHVICTSFPTQTPSRSRHNPHAFRQPRPQPHRLPGPCGRPNRNRNRNRPTCMALGGERRCRTRVRQPCGAAADRQPAVPALVQAGRPAVLCGPGSGHHLHRCAPGAHYAAAAADLHQGGKAGAGRGAGVAFMVLDRM